MAFEMKENREMKSCGDFPVKDVAGSNFGKAGTLNVHYFQILHDLLSCL